MNTALKIEPVRYVSPISLPEKESGNMAIRHRLVSGRTPIIGMRQALLRGVRPVDAMLTEPLLVHELVEDGGVWMTDLPEELFQIAEAMADFQPSGRVLVGGLGLGILPTVLTQRRGVETVTVVEINKDVINLCATDQYEVIQDDIFHFLSTTKRTFDCYMLDTWAGTNEGEWWHTVMPLRRIIGQRRGLQPVWCWAEDIMLGQVRPKLLKPYPHWHYEKLSPMSKRDVNFFLSAIGTPKWEKKYGKLVPERREK